MGGRLLLGFHALDNFMVLVYKRDFGKVQNFDQPQSLVRTVESKTQSVRRQVYNDRLMNRIGGGIGNIDCGVCMGMRL